MKMVNKIAILISWPRELDMFLAFVKNTPDDLLIVVDDFHYIADERIDNAKDIVELVDGKIDYVLLSKVLGKLKYKILFSTAQTLQEKITYSSYLKYIYAIFIGSFIDYSRMSKIFLKTIGRPLTGGGRGADKFGKYHIEKIIGEKVIRYPKGLDISMLRFPEKRWEDVFDIYLCHSNLDRNLITNSFSNARCINIGYPRYDNIPSVKHAKNIICNDIDNIDTSKPILLWMPTFIKMRGEIIDNIELWLPVITKLIDKYNVLIRPHPKSVSVNPEIVNYLMGLGFAVDEKKGRNLSILYQSADLVLADYGGSILSSVYMKKKLILLNTTSKKYIHWREKRMYTDIDVRKNVNTFNINDGVALIEQIESDIQEDDILKRNKLKEQYFGSEYNHKDLSEIFYKLTKELHN